MDQSGFANLKPRLVLTGITKRYPSVVANDDVSMSVRPGEIHAVLGENGAGKSTLMKIIYGVTKPDAGTIMWNGYYETIAAPSQARRMGIGMVFQHFSLFETLTVWENIALALDEHVPTAQLAAQITEVSEKYGLPIDPYRLVHSMSVGERQRVEIVRCLLQEPKLLIMDEPTSVLTPQAVLILFKTLRRLASEGCSILYISHKLDEIRRLCRRCVILRNGRKVLEDEVAEMSDEAIFSSMAGRSMVETSRRQYSPASARPGATPVLRVSHLKGPGIDDIGFALAPGEILGVAGLEGHGQSRLFKALVGLSPLEQGIIAIEGVPTRIRSPRHARRLGLVLVPEERKSEGLFNDLSTQANISLPVINEASPLHFLNWGAERRLVEKVTPTVNLAERYLPLSISALSGGNQQKAILARALLASPRCLFLFDPTRGVDVGAKQNIYAMMRSFVRDGGAILFYSTELDELAHLCDRCLVLYRNTIAGELGPEGLSQDRILAIASGHAGGAPAIALSSGA